MRDETSGYFRAFQIHGSLLLDPGILGRQLTVCMEYGVYGEAIHSTEYSIETA